MLRFYGPVNPMGSCCAWSVYLTTRLLGRLSPLSVFFFFFFDLGFTALSRIFHLYRADHSSKVGENWRTRRKTTWPSVSRTWLSHIWPKRGSNHSGEKPSKRLTSIVHILPPETDNCPSWISGRERMTVENISWSISTEECCWPRRGSNPRPSGLQ